MIRTYFRTVDGFSESRRFKTLKGARAYAKRRMGSAFDIGLTYAVDAYGTGKLTASGVSLETLLYEGGHHGEDDDHM